LPSGAGSAANAHTNAACWARPPFSRRITAKQHFSQSILRVGFAQRVAPGGRGLAGAAINRLETGRGHRVATRDWIFRITGGGIGYFPTIFLGFDLV
jgi:hypothetical protein